VVLRLPEQQRLTPAQLTLCPVDGAVGDRWAAGKRSPADQVAMMRADVAHLIANGQHGALFGDNLLVDLDLSEAHLPAGSRLRLGTAICEVSAKPHGPCQQFSRRFGKAALGLVVDKRWRSERLRGVYLRVVERGVVGPGDAIEVLERL
jgi:MOSC domain-containing protein YiiM